jgi:single-stranded-DNA-specific exonuclease
VHHVAFRLGPRLNAAGRLGEAERALELLTTDDHTRARALARELSKENDRRKRIEQTILSEAREAASGALADDEPCLVLASDGWHIGVVGIAAARLAEETGRPVVLVCLEGAEGRGSGRSAGGIPLHDALESCGHLLEDFGGHAEACGVRLRTERVPAFRAQLNRAVLALAPEHPLRFRADMVLAPHRMTGAVLADIERLAPFGQGNEPPVFIARDVPVLGDVRRMGRNGDHAAFLCRSASSTFRCVFFGGASALDALPPAVTFAYEPAINSYTGVDEIELHVKKMF